MTNNDILRSLRYALNLRDSALVDIFKLAGMAIDEGTVFELLKKQEEDAPFSPEQITAFLDGLIIHLRGPREDGAVAPVILVTTNNMVLKKLRIAFNLKEQDMLSVLELGGFAFTKAELSALFRKEGNRHYRVCGDQVLRYFLKGLTNRHRPEADGAQCH